MKSGHIANVDGALVQLSDRACAPIGRYVDEQLRDFILNKAHPCAGARSAFNRNTYRFGIYGELGSGESAETLAIDLCTFVRQFLATSLGYGTYVAVFERLTSSSELRFEAQLWKQLNALHQLDCAVYDVKASSDPDDPNFSFSFSGTALFVVGMHPGSSRHSRRFAFPTLVFNPRFQFDALRKRNQYDRFAATIRAREIRLQGSLNPNLDAKRERSEARQYSGRAVEEDWKCPFRA